MSPPHAHSTYPSSSPTLACLSRSVQSLHAVNANFQSCSEVLGSSTSAVPRLATALNNQQFFELVSVSDIRSAQYQLMSELEPQIKDLLHRTESSLNKLQNRESNLRSTIRQRSRTLSPDVSSELSPDDAEDEHDDAETLESLNRLRESKQNLLCQLEALDSQLVVQRAKVADSHPPS